VRLIQGALRASALQRLLSAAMSAISVLLVARALSPAEQGYYYAFTSLFFLQMLFELGFSFALVNLVAHARANSLAGQGAGQIKLSAWASGPVWCLLRRACW
jgi:O-antigen/teichoic acid export membrane protein